jgi:signal transduction histidine kinase
MIRPLRFLSRTSDLYVGKSTFLKIFLLGGIAIVSALFIWYTFNVIEKLQTDTREQVVRYVKLWQMAANSPTYGSEMTFIFDEIIVKATMPIIVLDENNQPISWRNLPGIDEHDTTQATMDIIKREAVHMEKTNGRFSLQFAGSRPNYLLYGDSEVINQLRQMPFIQIGIVVAFMIVGIIGFQNIRRSEERYIWVGMAKEAAHQLGTPISSLMGWLEVLDSDQNPAPECSTQNELLNKTTENMKVDVERLQRVANRFSQIGSVPTLKPASLNDHIEEVVEYYRRRLPFQGEGIRIDFHPGDVPQIPLNSELLTWGIENLVKNSLQAIDSKTGRIDITTMISPDKKFAIVEVIDNGKGITVAAARKIFRPGFTTKKRGWGLGLTLVKRIVEECHNGRIWLVRSKPGETVFRAEFPFKKQ